MTMTRISRLELVGKYDSGSQIRYLPEREASN